MIMVFINSYYYSFVNCYVYVLIDCFDINNIYYLIYHHTCPSIVRVLNDIHLFINIHFYAFYYHCCTSYYHYFYCSYSCYLLLLLIICLYILILDVVIHLHPFILMFMIMTMYYEYLVFHHCLNITYCYCNYICYVHQCYNSNYYCCYC